ncbi:MAG: M23 family metallopeptidase [Actinomycetota bacterium]|nr:M23 family metallopeptidase [Actinomycetota bacterium]
MAATTTTSTTFPPALLAIANSVHRTPPNSTARLLAALQPLQKLGYTAQQAAIIGMGQFPVGGPASFSDDWLEPRPGPVPKLHPGIDIVASSGTPLRAPVDGVLKYDTSDPNGYGVAAVVTAPDGTYYLMAHMSATVSTLSSGSPVKSGQVVGFVGQTGFATGPHCHFEIHPQGGTGIDAKPLLDRWLADAVAAAPALIDSIRASQAPPPTVAVSVPVVPAFPSVAQSSLHLLPAQLPISASGSAPPPYPLAAGGLAALLAVVAWWSSVGRREETGLNPVLMDLGSSSSP